MAETKRSAVAATRQRRVKRARLTRACAPQAHSSLVTRSISFPSCHPGPDFFESKPAWAASHYQKDEYENIGSLYLLNGAGRDRFRPIAAGAARTAGSALGYR